MGRNAKCCSDTSVFGGGTGGGGAIGGVDILGEKHLHPASATTPTVSSTAAERKNRMRGKFPSIAEGVAREFVRRPCDPFYPTKQKIGENRSKNCDNFVLPESIVGVGETFWIVELFGNHWFPSMSIILSANLLCTFDRIDALSLFVEQSPNSAR